MKSVVFCWLLLFATMGQNLHAQHASLPVKLDFYEKGKGNPVKVLFLHGYSDSWFSFYRLINELPDEFHCIAVSLRGHGNSPKPEKGYSQDEMVEDIIYFMNQQHLDKVVVVGHSMGASVAMRMALQYPERTSSLILLAAFASFEDKEFIPDLLKATQALKDPVDPDFIRDFQLSTLARKLPAAFMKTVISESKKLNAVVWRETLKGLVNASYETSLIRYQKPVLLIWGEADQQTLKDDQDRLLKAFPNAYLMRYEKTGHAVHWERPGQVAGDMLAFLELIRTSPE
ncbi:alpha/beta hydrolase [Flavihumibacter cheonanensis]|uniref:alpha/beta fold hydrolase n=1 Tax=Flavihumibacter cheonanensis TaxID=1442385 RepID=UPI001EF83248|nr:alpha/beta hydrolase [Flavihumibacter cheonanensis]MCG7753407.1 alpha/beta hydrolase [Flavihumibacter cheonanensis]